MAILTKEQKEKYLASGGGACPFCGDSDISGDSVEIEATEAWQNVSCSACGGAGATCTSSPSWKQMMN